MNLPKRTYTLDEAAEELHISRDTLELLIPKPAQQHCPNW